MASTTNFLLPAWVDVINELPKLSDASLNSESLELLSLDDEESTWELSDSAASTIVDDQCQIQRSRTKSTCNTHNCLNNIFHDNDFNSSTPKPWKLHGRMQHETQRSPRSPKLPSFESTYSCTDCTTSLKSANELRVHVSQAHCDDSKVLVCRDPHSIGLEASTLTIDIPLAGCEDCAGGKEYNTYYGAAQHLRRWHFSTISQALNSDHWPTIPELRRWIGEIPDSEMSQKLPNTLVDISIDSAPLTARNLVSPGNTEARRPKPNLFPGPPRWFKFLESTELSLDTPAEVNNNGAAKVEPAGSMVSSWAPTRSLAESEATSESDGAFEVDQSCPHKFPRQIELFWATHVLHAYSIFRYQLAGTKRVHSGEACSNNSGPSTQQTAGCNGTASVGASSSNCRYAENGNNEDQDDERRRKRSRALQSGVSSKGSDDSLLFACPFYKWKPHRYHKCQQVELTAVSRVKQHLTRRHRIPIHCPACNMQFERDDNLTAHIRQRPPCEMQAQVPWEGVTVQQNALLQARSDRNKTPENQWYDVFRILFPESDLPESPYMDSMKSQVLQNFCNYVREKYLPTYEALIEQYIPEQHRAQECTLRPYISSIVQKALETLFSQYDNEVRSDSGLGRLGAIQITQSSTIPAFYEKAIMPNNTHSVHPGTSADAGYLPSMQGSIGHGAGTSESQSDFIPIFAMDAVDRSMAAGFSSVFGEVPSQEAIDSYLATLGPWSSSGEPV